MNKIIKAIKAIKNIPSDIVNSYKLESKRTSYTRFLILTFNTIGIYIFTMIFIVGRMLVEKVLIFNPEHIDLSIKTLEVVENLSIILRFTVGLLVLSTLLIGYKEYQDFCVRKIIKKYQLDVIE